MRHKIVRNSGEVKLTLKEGGLTSPPGNIPDGIYGVAGHYSMKEPGERLGGAFSFFPSVMDLERRLLPLRALVILLGALVYQFLPAEKTHPWLAWIVLVAGGVHLLVFYRKVWPENSRFSVSPLTLTLADCLAASAWVLATGGADSPFHGALYLALLAASLRHRTSHAASISGLYAAIYLGILALDSTPINGPSTLVRVIYFFFTGTFASLLRAQMMQQPLRVARRLARTNQSLSWEVQIREKFVKELREAKDELQFTLDAANVTCWEWDLTSGTTKVSHNFAAVHQRAPEDFPGDFYGILKYVHPEDRARVKEVFRASAKTGAMCEIDYRLLQRNGTYGWFEAKGRIFTDPSSKSVRMLGICLNISANKELEAELRQRLEELALIDNRKNDFLAMLSHELRNPLAAIQTSLDLMKRSDFPLDNLRKISLLAESQTQHLRRLVDDLLDISRISTGKITLRREPVDLGKVVQSLENHFSFVFGEKRIRFTVSLPEKRLMIWGDPTRISQAISNLLHNALKFTPPNGEVRLTLRSDGQAVTIQVQDNGLGIDSETLPKLFRRFYQGDSPSDQTASGLGLGLALVKDLIELHQGRVEAASNGADQGSRFTITLPLLESDSAHRGSAEIVPLRNSKVDLRARRPIAAPVQAHTKRKVVIIEDNQAVAESLAMLLEIAGHEPLTAGSGEEGLALIEKCRPDGVVCDIGLPGISGYEVAERLRQSPQFERLPIIALSGYGQAQDRKHALNAGFNRHLTKPIQSDTLEATLSTLWRRSHQLSSQPAQIGLKRAENKTAPPRPTQPTQPTQNVDMPV